MQPPTVREVIGMLEREGWVQVRMTGGHRQFAKGGKLLTVPGNSGDHLKPGTWSSIKRSAGW